MNVAAVAAGVEAVADLERLLKEDVHRGTVRWAAHQDLAVAWHATHRWVSAADDGEVLVVLDGQLHNLFEDDLSQADLLLRRYREVGDDLARGLLGDFVLIVLDRSRHTLLVARDPVGVRPWYQATSGRRSSGASDEGTLCRLPWVDDSLDEEKALAYLADEIESRGPTFHRGIRTLQPGSTWRSAQGSARTWRSHHWDIHPEPELTWDEAVERCRAVVDEAVRSRIRAAGAATSELSGGLDSSSIVGTAVTLGYDDVLAGRLVFDESEADEARFSDAVLEHWGVPSVSARPWRPSEDELVELAARLHRPPPDPNVSMMVSLHRAFLRAGRQTALTGVGGDDAFMARSRQSRVLSAVQQRQLAALGPVLREDIRNPLQGWRRTWRPVLGHFVPRKRRRPPAHLSSPAAGRLGLVDRLNVPMQRLTGVSAIDERAHGLTSGYVAWIMDESAVGADLSGWRASHPFFDPRVITATYGVNPWFAVRNGQDRALEIAVFGDRLPPLVRDRRDKGEFSGGSWTAVMPSVARRRLLSGPLAERGLLDTAQLDGLLELVRRHRPEAAMYYYRAVALDLWLRTTGE